MANFAPHNRPAPLPPGGNVVRLQPLPASWSAPAEQEGQLFEYWRVITANFGWMLLLTVAGGGLGFIVAEFQPAMYQARTVLDIRSLNENLLSSREGSAMGATESVLPEAYLQTEIKILQSDSLRKRAIDRLPVPKPVQGLHAADVPFWRSATGLLDPAMIPRRQLLEDAAKRVKIRALGNTRIVEMLCAARDAQLAADVCNSLAQTYQQHNSDSRYESTKETGEWLQNQLDEVRKRLTKAESELKDEARESATLIDSGGENLAQGKLQQLQAELARAQADRMAKQSEYDTAAGAAAAALTLTSDSEPLREYRMRLTDLRRQLAEVSATKTPEHYEYRQLKSQIAEIQSAIVKEQSDLVNRLRTSYESAKRHEGLIEAAYEQQASNVLQHGDKAVKYMMLKRDVETERKLYETLLQKVNEVGLATALRTSTINVVDQAVAPGAPYTPSQTLNVVVGLFGGLIVGFTFSFLRVRADHTLHRPGEASVVLQLRELGVIPAVRSRTFKLLLNRAKPEPRKTISELVGEDVPGSGGQTAVVKYNPSSAIALATWLRNPPDMAEAFSGAMNSLLFASGDGSSAKVIVVTSPEPGDGKTTVATNLAISLAQIGRRVVIVDGDLRKPRLHDIFGKEVNAGLADILDDTTAIDDAVLADSIFETQVKNLSVLPTKSAGEGISAKLHSGRMRTLLERLRRDFEVIIIDSPPMLNVSDARVLGWLSDGVLLVLRARRTTRDAALAARECLLQDGIVVVGTILNDWLATRDSKYGSYGAYAHPRYQ